jgi:hypothetical protein
MRLQQLKEFQERLREYIIEIESFQCDYSKQNSGTTFMRDCVVDGCPECHAKYCVTHHNGQGCICDG